MMTKIEICESVTYLDAAGSMSERLLIGISAGREWSFCKHLFVVMFLSRFCDKQSNWDARLFACVHTTAGMAQNSGCFYELPTAIR